MISDIASLGSAKAIVFDVYGTLVDIQERRRPYLCQAPAAARQGGPRAPCHDDAAQVRSNRVGLAGAARLLGKELPACLLRSTRFGRGRRLRPT